MKVLNYSVKDNLLIGLATVFGCCINKLMVSRLKTKHHLFEIASEKLEKSFDIRALLDV